MKPFRLLPVLCAAAAVWCGPSLRAQTLYWDTNDATAGAGGATPTGTWGTDAFWSGTSAGISTTGAWSSGGVAYFSAGTDATAGYGVSIAGTQVISGLTVEEGSPIFSFGTLSFAADTPFIIASNATINSVLTGIGSLTKTGTGTLSLNGINTYSGGTIISEGTLNLTGSVTHTGADTYVTGIGGPTVYLTVTGGGDLNTNQLRVAINTGYSGHVDVTGAGSTVTSVSYLYVGEAGNGSMDITGGGAVSSISTSIGNNTGGQGSVLLSGTGSLLTNTLNLYVGSLGTGDLAIEAGADAINVDGSIGNNTGGTGTVTVTGTGSTWTNTGNLFVGAQGTGTLTISGNGAVSSYNTTVGNNTGGTGTLIVDGTGSTLSVTDVLRVGWQGTGYLDVRNGADITSASGILGETLGVTGTAKVHGSGSSWTVSGQNLYVGNGANGILYLYDQAQINVGAGTGTLHLAHSAGGAGILKIGTDGTSYFAGGILNADNVTTGAGLSGELRFATTATAGSPYYFTRDGTAGGTPVIISGDTDVIFSNGYNVVASSNNYTGPTLITGGTAVALSQAGSAHQFGYGDITVGTGGTLLLKGSTTLENNLVTVNSGGKLAGDGGIGSNTGRATVMNPGSTLAPGISGATAISTLSFDDLTLHGGAFYEWNLKDPTGLPGANWDLVSISDYSFTLHFDSSVTPANKFTIKAISLDAVGNPGTATGFANQTYNWVIFDGGPSAIDFANTFNPAMFNVDASAFVTNLGAGSFTISSDTFSNTLVLNFTPVPEPSTYALIIMGLAVVVFSVRRKNRIAP